jgi:hypothetical protein
LGEQQGRLTEINWDSAKVQERCYGLWTVKRRMLYTGVRSTLMREIAVESVDELAARSWRNSWGTAAKHNGGSVACKAAEPWQLQAVRWDLRE